MRHDQIIILIRHNRGLQAANHLNNLSQSEPHKQDFAKKARQLAAMFAWQANRAETGRLQTTPSKQVMMYVY